MAPHQRQPSEADLHRVVGVFETLMQRLMATHVPELASVEMTMSQTKAMYLVIAAGPLRMSEFASRLGVGNSTATGQVDRLVELGLLERHEDVADRRQVVVSATPHGVQILERFRELNSRRLREMLAHIDSADLTIVERALLILDAAVLAEASQPSATITEGIRS
jgi:DNA-binding MarR family transcriptional regulator